MAVCAAVTAGGCSVSPTIGGTATTVSPPAFGSPVRDGTLEFEVLDLDEVAEVGEVSEPGLSIRADGVFVVVTVAVRNAGSAPHTFVDRDQTLTDSRGRQFAVSMAANIYGNLDVPSTKMAPGQRLEVDLAFDVPVGTVPRSIVLRESAASGGVTAALP